MNQFAKTPNDIGHALRNARKQQRLSQQALATRSGVWQETISKIENGSPGTRLETVFDLFTALNLEIQITDRNKDKKKLSKHNNLMGRIFQTSFVVAF